MAVMVQWILAFACTLLTTAETQKLVTKIHKHDTPIDIVPKNLKLSKTVADLLQVDADSTFESKVLNGSYSFKSRELLNKALLHGDFKNKLRGQFKDSYIPLDHVGTMVLDYMISRHILLNSVAVDAKQISSMKTALLNRDALAFIALKNHLDEFIYADGKVLNEGNIVKFKKEIEDKDFFQKIVENYPVAKNRPHSGEFAARMFKALVGAVYVDSGYSIQTTDDVFMPMFKEEAELVINKVLIRNQPVM